MPSLLLFSSLKNIYCTLQIENVYYMHGHIIMINITFENVGYCKMCKLMGTFFLSRVTLEIVFIVLCCGTIGVSIDEHIVVKYRYERWWTLPNTLYSNWYYVPTNVYFLFYSLRCYSLWQRFSVLDATLNGLFHSCRWLVCRSRIRSIVCI